MKYKVAILKSIEFIEKNLKNNLSLKTISNHVGYSEYHFSRVFKSEMNMSIMEYVQERRLLLASKEIFEGRKIVDVSYDYQYDTHSGFSKAFKKKFGFTPTQHLIYAIKILENIKNENREGLIMKNENSKGIFIEPSIEFTSAEQLYNQLILNLKTKYNCSDLEEIEKAYLLSCEAHKDQYRRSGEPYVIHPLNIALILSQIDVDKESIIVGLLYDVITKNTPITLDVVESKFSREISLLLDGRVFVIQLASRLHNMRTIKHMSPEIYKEKAEETIDIFSPIAAKLNLIKLKMELDDLSIKYLID
ncbi:HD domain-containing protein [Paraclostridium bifermentans]|nr:MULTISPECIES: AraC family transcriptional regulator [Paraclostridium]MBZ6004620.1 HD domain-containing protein [Paraclostridium bifermentans]MCR1874342.1 HD domain-containing protein [Paraclostridium bifermentans]MDU0296921.1 HD domain-containing protein [Paraclostridium sp. MRS3W1]